MLFYEMNQSGISVKSKDESGLCRLTSEQLCKHSEKIVVRFGALAAFTLLQPAGKRTVFLLHNSFTLSCPGWIFYILCSTGGIILRILIYVDKIAESKK